jgi:ribosomal protein L11 methyltransferase
MSIKKKWIEVTIRTHSESFEILENFLFEMGSCGTLETEEGIKGYFHELSFDKKIKSRLNTYIKHLRQIGFTIQNPVYTLIPEQDWSTNWRKHFTTLQITPNMIVKPPWVPCKSRKDQIIIDIMPRMAFGTGTHETTKLCLVMLNNSIRPNDHVLDIGTGSGILAIAAAKMGASKVIGIDTDENAIHNAIENVQLNRLENQINIRYGSIVVACDKIYDVICANIDRTTLIPMMTTFKELLNTKGYLILSGILNSEEIAIMDTVRKSDLTLVQKNHREEWLGLLLKHTEKTKHKVKK